MHHLIAPNVFAGETTSIVNTSPDRKDVSHDVYTTRDRCFLFVLFVIH